MLWFIWICAVLGLAMWSLFVWALHALLTLDPAGWSDAAGRAAERLPFGEWIERWIPGWQALLQAVLDATQTAWAWVGDAAPLVIWVVWSLGALAVLGTAAGLTMLVVVLQPKVRGALAASR